MRSRLAKWEIAAENNQTRSAECLSQRNQQGSIAIRSRAVRQNKAICS